MRLARKFKPILPCGFTFSKEVADLVVQAPEYRDDPLA
jgi:hypothetical protein